MAGDRYRFGGFVLDAGDRRLCLNGVPVDLNARYLDALLLLVRDAGRLVSKDRFMTEVWRGVPVTDEALTQCIRTLRRQLGDSATDPRFIETVPRHGYRFIAPVAPTEAIVGAIVTPADRWRRIVLPGVAGTVGGGVAGIVGGLFYGFVGAAQTGMGAMSVLLVLLCVTATIATIGAAGVSVGIAIAEIVSARRWHAIIGGAIGGMVVGAVVKLIGVDALTLLFGHAPADITGAAEGAILGGAVGLGAWLDRSASLRRALAVAGLCGGLAGASIAAVGGRLMGSSLALLAQQFPGSRLRLDLFGEPGFGPLSRIVTGGLEGLLFGACVVGAMAIARRGFASMQ